MNIQTAEAKNQETFFMTEADNLKEKTLQKLVAKTINGTQAAEVLKLSVRHIRRMKKRFIKEGVKGILHSSRGKSSNYAMPESKKKEIIKIIKTSYPDFGPTLASEKLLELHKINFSNETIRQIMIKEELWKVKTQTVDKFPHIWRARKDCYGQMEQYDGSYHDWFEGRLKNERSEVIISNCLLASVDDATGKITYAKFDDSEGVVPTMSFWKEYIIINGKPCNIYVDKFSTYKNNQKKNTVQDLELTQFQRASKQLDINIIHAHSPQAKGRIERLFQTLQDRLVREMRLKNISTIAEANIFLTTTFIPWFNSRFTVEAKKQTNLHTILTSKELLQLPSFMSLQTQRTIMNDYTVMHQGSLYQVDPKQLALVRIGDRVIVQTRLNGEIFIFKETAELQFKEIMERAKKVTALKLEDARRFGHKPSSNHPWQFNQQKVLLLNPVLA